MSRLRGLLAGLLAASFAAAALAQSPPQQRRPQPPPQPPSNAAERARAVMALAGGPPKIFIVGDSTAADYAPDRYPQMGWGQVFKCRLDDKVTVVNLARGGRSTKSFIFEGLFSDMIKQVAPGDTVLIQFGHNDANAASPDRFTDPEGDFRENLRAYVAAVRAKSAVPVLVTPVTRRVFVNGRATESHAPYSRAVRAVAAATGTPLIDLSVSSRALLDRLGEERSERYYLNLWPEDGVARFPQGVTDNTHFSEVGARAIAALVAQGLKQSGAPVAVHVRDGADAEAPQPRLGGPDCP